MANFAVFSFFMEKMTFSGRDLNPRPRTICLENVNNLRKNMIVYFGLIDERINDSYKEKPVINTAFLNIKFVIKDFF